MSNKDTKREAAETPPSEPGPEQSSPAGELKTPREWAIAKGHLLLANPVNLPAGAIRIGPAATDRTFPPYVAADVLHGWSESAHHAQGEKAFKLSEADYDAALVAAAAYPAVAPHARAVTKECPFKSGKPRRFTSGVTLDKTRAAVAALEKRFRAVNKPVKVTNG